MLPGPVFHAELVTTARRPRYYTARFVYGAILLFFVWQNSPDVQSWYYPSAGNGISIQDLSRLGKALFSTFVTVQGLAVLILTPALVAGAIADERQRKTLHYLLASRLSSSEIVLGKLAARFLHLVVFLAIGLPVTSLLSLFGGVDPALVLAAFATTIFTAFFLAAMSILVSTHARRPREAISLSYMLAAFWLFVPTFITILMPRAGPEWLQIYEWIRPVNDWIAPSSPFSLILSLPSLGSFNRLVNLLLWMTGLQVAYGLLFILIAVLRLRAVGQKEGDGAARGWMKALGRKKSILPRPECGDDAMMWKERYVSRTSVTTKVTAGIVVAIVLAALGYLTYDFARPAFIELWAQGYGSIAHSNDRSAFNGYLRAMCTLIYVLWVLGVASAASSAVTSEREEDSWVSLLTTPLTGVEIMRAKMFGAVWGLRWVGLLLLTLWVVGLAAGSIHPFGFLAVLLESAVFLWFATALGAYLSLRSRNSGRALLAAIALLFVANGGYLLFCIPLHNESWLLFSGVTPLVEAFSLVSYDDVRGLFSGQWWGRRDTFHDSAGILASIVGTLGYLMAAALLTQRAFSRFDAEADRPRRTTANAPAAEPETEGDDEIEPEPEADRASGQATETCREPTA